MIFLMWQTKSLIFLVWTILFHKNLSETFEIIIKENIPVNFLVSDLSSFIQHRSSSLRNKVFSLISDRKANSLFILNADGKLRSSKLIDREQLCIQIDECCKEPCSFSLLVAVLSQSMTEPRTFECKIQIEDENDNAPKFNQNNLTIFIKESEPVGSIFKLPEAIDLDSDKFSVRHYELIENQSSSPKFSLEQSRSGTAKNLQLIQTLDREKMPSYQLTLLATDGGNPPLSGKLIIDIKVLDVNDNPPRLLRSNYKKTLKENEFLTEHILTIEAEDLDENENAQLRFKIINENRFQTDANRYFRIEQLTGRLFLNEKLDYEKQEKYRFFVEVYNKLGNVESATATVLIDVENVNDEVPSISINYLKGNNDNAIIEENDGRVVFVALATVTDKDKGIGGQVICKLNNFQDTFEIQSKDLSQFPNQYLIQTKLSLDREKVAFYKVIMECEDRGDPILRAKKEINVRVKDVNDNDPIIVIDKDVSVKENSPKRTLVTKIEATDDDEGKNGKLIFSIAESEDKTLRMLEIDSETGELRTKEVIDREADIESLKGLTVKLVVSDNGKPQRSSVKTFTVNIEDENDNPPQFANELTEFFVTENQPPRYTLGEILVSDKDDESKLRLTIVPSSDPHRSPFILFKNDSRFFLGTIRSLDWEREKSFMLSVIASDGTGSKSHTVTSKIRVIVKDENDNSPVIIFPSQKNFTIQRLSCHERSGFTVLTVSAVDKDSQETNNGKLSYQISDNKDLFMIDSTSGAITTARQMSRSDMGRWEVKVIVRDFGSPSRETSLNLSIEVDESKPHLYSDSYKDNEDNGKFTSNNYFWTKEGFLVISLVILLLFLLSCVCMVLYMRHIRGVFPVIPDIFSSCQRTSKRRMCSKSGSCGKSTSHIPFDQNQRSSPLNFQQTNHSQQEKGVPPYFLNQYDSFPNSVTFPVNPYRQYETMKYQPYSGTNTEANMDPNLGTYSYDKLFYSPTISNGDGTIQIPFSKLNTNYESRTQSIPSSLNSNLPVCRRVINNFDNGPLIQECFNDRFPFDQCPKVDDAESFVVAQSVSNTPDLRGHAKPSEKIDTYAITYPLEQSTFV